MIESMIKINNSSEKILPKRRMESETGRDKWEMIQLAGAAGPEMGSARKVLQIAEQTLSFNPLPVIIKPDNQSAAQSHIQFTGWKPIKTGN